MAQIVNEVIELGATFDNHRIRKCTIDDRTHVSIIDVTHYLQGRKKAYGGLSSYNILT
jgi:hypothetical protein